MSRTVVASAESLALRDVIKLHRDQLLAILERYGATNPRLFGSVARGDADDTSDIDVMIDLLPDEHRSELLRLGGVNAAFEQTLNHPVDVIAPALLRPTVSQTALADAVPL